MKLNLICLRNVAIQNQLELEEVLLRSNTENWCIINEGSSPAIVMGISGKPELLINRNFFQKTPIPLIRRFSGGGTVIVDENTHFITFICNKTEVNISPYPESIMRWTETIYKPLFEGHPFSLKENDYVMGSKKFGGNAQYIQKDRWLHHSTLLWSYKENLMNYLLVPPKIPQYREHRNHSEFLCCLKEFFPCRKTFQINLQEILKEKFELNEVDFTTANAMEKKHRITTSLVDWR